MLRNIDLTQGRIMAEAIMIALTRKGVNRQEAHEHLRKLSVRSAAEKRHLGEILQEDNIVTTKLSKKEIEEALNPRNYLGTALRQVDLMTKMTRAERKLRSD